MRIARSPTRRAIGIRFAAHNVTISATASVLVGKDHRIRHTHERETLAVAMLLAQRVSHCNAGAEPLAQRIDDPGGV